MTNNKIVTAATILNLLLKKHSEDICVAECKSGQSWVKAGSMKRFDLFAMKRSYSQPMTWIYEIKVTRSDFLQDNKWQTYLPYCTDFYFVAPTGIVDVNEVPADAGLLLSSKTGTKLFCKKKAPFPEERASGIYMANFFGYRTFVTIEPIMEFTLDALTAMIKLCKPSFVNIGANTNSKVKLPEPSPEKITALIEELKHFTEVRIKPNLKRLMK